MNAYYQKLLVEAGLQPTGRKNGYASSKSFERKLALYKAMYSPERLARIREAEIVRKAAKSKRYSHSRRKLVMKRSADARKAAGLRITDPICTCGSCEVCRARKRRNAAEALRRADTFYWQYEESPSIFSVELAATLSRMSPRRGVRVSA